MDTIIAYSVVFGLGMCAGAILMMSASSEPAVAPDLRASRHDFNRGRNSVLRDFRNAIGNPDAERKCIEYWRGMATENHEFDRGVREQCDSIETFMREM